MRLAAVVHARTSIPHSTSPFLLHSPPLPSTFTSFGYTENLKFHRQSTQTMAPPPSCSFSSHSSSSTSPRLPPRRSHRFTPIPEGSENEELGGLERRRLDDSAALTSSPRYHHPTPLHKSPPATTTAGVVAGARCSGKKRIEKSVAVTCNNCRPNSRDKTASSVVPVAGGANKDHFVSYSVPSPNGIFKSIVCALSRRSPKPLSETASASVEDRWKIAATELSHKLVQASRKREEAILEASRLKYSVAELEKKLSNLEAYCQNFNSGFDVRTGGEITEGRKLSPNDGRDQIIQNFRFFVSEARTGVRSLSRALTAQICQMSSKVLERISSLLQPYDIKISQSENPKILNFYLEALLNSILFEDFESAGFMKSSTNRILNPLDRCQAQYAAFNALHRLTWEEVLSKGTKHFSEDFSRFCDRKMSEIVGLLGWNRAWTEPLLQAFFGASKCVWLVHLLANSVHPGLTIFRVDKGLRFDSMYMDDEDVDPPAQIHPTMVQIMVAPGFYVYDDVIKCRVLCKYTNGIAHLGANGSGTHER
ncbi:hypothetical protein V2J09_014713 [Rumex salicifolius]